MAFDSVPWFVGGGAEHSPAVARMLAYAATSGSTGIVWSGDLRVRDLDVPGTAVVIGSGAAILKNRYAGGSRQSYLVRNESDTELEIPATGSGGGATRYVIVRIDDPEFGGQVPADVVNGPYVRPVLVNSITDLQYPHVVLAKIVQPASTGTITQAMITDLREMAIPRELSVVRPNAIVASDTGLTLGDTSSQGELFPNSGGSQTITIPDWATRAQIRAEWLGVKNVPGSGYGGYWVEFGPYDGPSQRQYSTQRFAWDADSSANTYRDTWIMHDDVFIDKSIRGTDQIFYMKANITSGAKTPKVILDDKSGVVLSVRFLEAADPSST